MSVPRPISITQVFAIHAKPLSPILITGILLRYPLAMISKIARPICIRQMVRAYRYPADIQVLYTCRMPQARMCSMLQKVVLMSSGEVLHSMVRYIVTL